MPADPTAPEPSDHLAENLRFWNAGAAGYVDAGERNWASPEITWGIWGVDNAVCPLLPNDMAGLQAVELGCGTGYGAARMARLGATVTGVDLSPAQLRTARRLEAEHGLGVTFLERNAEQTGLDTAAFDFALSEYGAALWCEPGAWLREAARLLRPGGRLHFFTCHPLPLCCAPPDGSLPIRRELLTDWFGPRRFDWSTAIDEPGGIEFVPTVGDWFRHAADAGFDVVDYREVRAPEETSRERSWIPLEWARRFPAEHAFFLRRR